MRTFQCDSHERKWKYPVNGKSLNPLMTTETETEKFWKIEVKLKRKNENGNCKIVNPLCVTCTFRTIMTHALVQRIKHGCLVWMLLTACPRMAPDFSYLLTMKDFSWALMYIVRIRLWLLWPVFALSGIASQNATQIDPPCDSKCHMRRTHVRYKESIGRLTKTLNVRVDDNGLRMQSSVLHSSS